MVAVGINNKAWVVEWRMGARFGGALVFLSCRKFSLVCPSASKQTHLIWDYLLKMGTWQQAQFHEWMWIRQLDHLILFFLKFVSTQQQ